MKTSILLLALVATLGASAADPAPWGAKADWLKGIR